MMLFAGILLMFPFPVRAQGGERSAGAVLTKPEKNFPPVERKHYKFLCSIRTKAFPCNLYHYRRTRFQFVTLIPFIP